MKFYAEYKKNMHKKDECAVSQILLLRGHNVCFIVIILFNSI